MQLMQGPEEIVLSTQDAAPQSSAVPETTNCRLFSRFLLQVGKPSGL